jgi:hypothetical protein
VTLSDRQTISLAERGCPHSLKAPFNFCEEGSSIVVEEGSDESICSCWQC